METKGQEEIPSKGSFIVNPKTSRPVKVGSRTWVNLVKEGLVSNKYQDKNELAEAEVEVEGETSTDNEEKINTLNKTLPRGVQAVRGRGKYAGKIVKRNKQSTPQEICEHAAKVASRVVARRQPEVNDAEDIDDVDYDYGDIEKELERMILEEMMIGEPKLTPKKTSKKTVSDNTKYYTHHPQEYDNEEEDEGDYYDFGDADEERFYDSE